MPNGKPGDGPISDMLLWGAHPFPADVEALIRELIALDPHALWRAVGKDEAAWAKGKRLDHARARLREELDRAQRVARGEDARWDRRRP